MVRYFEQDLNLVKEKLNLMANLVVSNIYFAIKMLVDRTDSQSGQIFAQEEKINSLQIEIDNDCQEFIALHQPVASDLRLLISALKISSELERIGDQAVNITQASLELIRQPELKPLVDTPRMADLVQKMVKDALDSFVNKDSLLARDVLQRDDRIDDFKDQIRSELVEFMSRDPGSIYRALQLIMISRHLERIADHATNIAEDVVFLVEGKDIRHHLEQRSVHKLGRPL
jgi:phosphate transport system protein